MTDATKAGRWKPGQSGNPTGRKVGQRHRSTVILEALMEADAKKIVAAVLLQAKAGDLAACQMILSRVCPIPRDRRLTPFDLPAIDTAAGIALAQAAVVAAVAGGELRPSEGEALASLIELRRRSVETEDFEARLIALEASRGTP